MKISRCLMIVALFTLEEVVKSTYAVTGNGDSDTRSELESLKKTVAELSKQVMMQQFFVEEKIRGDGYSGIKLVRTTTRGNKNYDSATHLSPAAFAIHDHSNYDRTLGLGEMSADMNGVDFRTRHNDYKLVMASTTSREYNEVEDIPFPDVPPEVLKKSTVEDQVIEMREWFKAFHKQDKSVRDYTKYFKPVLCYLEGSWTLDKELVEPFPSDRHWLDAKSWNDLHEKNRFTAYTGVKNRQENVAYLPTAIVSVNMTSGVSKYAQWNYRILCHPIQQDIPLSYFQQEDDLTFRVDTGQTIFETFYGRAARFKLYDPNRKQNYQILDEIFASIPGKDNHGGNLSFTVFGEEMFETAYSDIQVLLNTAYYHRSYKSFKNGAGGITYAAYGFNDDNLWVAQTSQPRTASLETEQCTLVPNQWGKLKKQCALAELRVSYALPLEVVFMTPLLRWNPYNIVMHNDTQTSVKDGRNGGKGYQALNGIDKIRYYKTPVEFFTGPLDKSDPADTVKNYIYVLAPDGVKKVSASGTRIILQALPGIGKIRLRYPIAPVHGEGSSVWKELNALKDNVLGSVEGPPSSVTFEMSVSVQDPPGEHTHDLKLPFEKFTALLAGEQVDVTTEEAQEHTHDLTVIYVPKTKTFKYIYCDSEVSCTDGHASAIILQTKNVYTELP